MVIQMDAKTLIDSHFFARPLMLKFVRGNGYSPNKGTTAGKLWRWSIQVNEVYMYQRNEI